ncbi:MAG: contractile injection system protein, VgrG/Pvc8 family [Gammaproteobacteria bacterium]|nr:contractile injection system protein, VgrG/Pvc8 family [Gammaproteobacteria bacterium]
MPEVTYTLLIDDRPAASELLAAIQQVEVEDHADVADMLRLRIAIGVTESCADWSVLDEQDLFTRLQNLKLRVGVGSRQSETLIDAYVIESSARFANQPGQSVLDVVATDATVLMNLEERVRAWPDMSDSQMATEVFGSSQYDFDLQVEDTDWQREEREQTVMQRGTDIQFLMRLARRNGFECYVETSPETGRNEGHFHPPRLDAPAQGVLSVNLGEATNVDGFNVRHEMLRPAVADAMGLHSRDQAEQEATADSASQEGLGRDSTLGSDRPRRVLLTGRGLVQEGELQPLARAVTDRSAWAIRAEGELNAAAYGGILRAKRPVMVRGAGRQFSGRYYVERVHHRFTGDSYTQAFTLRRNASSLTGQERFTGDDGLPAAIR